MGNVLSSGSTGACDSKYVTTSESETMSDASVSRASAENDNDEEQFHDAINEDKAREKAREDEMIEFRKQLSIKREQRREILDRHRSEKENLETSLENERKLRLDLYENNRQLREILMKNNIEIPEKLQPTKENSDLTGAIVKMREEFEALKSNNNRLRKDLSESNSALQNAYSDIADLNAQNTESMKQINALKEVISVSKTMINLREQQLNELKNKLNEIERSLADREANMLSTDLRQEYERQLQNIRTLRGLYEERARLAEVTRQSLVRELEDQKILKQAEINKCRDLAAKVEELEEKISSLLDVIENKNNQISCCQNETRGIKEEMSVVNKLFSQVLLGYKTKQDLDKLVHRLEENHGILTQMAEKENESEASSALPKLLLELVNEVDEKEESREQDGVNAKTEEDETDQPQKSNDGAENLSNNATAEEIVQNLPKVWRVLMELLSHQNVVEVNPAEKVTTCYKSVETKSGPVLVPSVSQTYIRLKDLIIEKLALIKEVNRTKQLNSHLEARLEEQEKRLCLVTSELSKTWHVVGRLRRHHHQLHTHEKILKYELQQKRKLLNELKEELEYCREKWEQAREKNTQSERDWRKLRAEFSSRKTKTGSPSFNNSGESGYSDERPSDDSSESNDESEYVTEPLIRCKKRLKKSFETILDSSTDFNLAAEREDPASDMLDVADLPLDTQESDENHDPSASGNLTSEELLKIEKPCEETEDEVCDIGTDSCVEDASFVIDNSHSNVNPTDEKGVIQTNEKESCPDILNQSSGSSQLQPINTASNVTPAIDPAAILNSIKQQNERLAKRDRKLEKLEKNSEELLKKTQLTTELSNQLNDTLDHLINRPTSSIQNNSNTCEMKINTPVIGTETGNGSFNPQETEIDCKHLTSPQNKENLIEDKNIKTQTSAQDLEQETNIPQKSTECISNLCENVSETVTLDCKNIVENVKQQNEQVEEDNKIVTGDESKETENSLKEDDITSSGEASDPTTSFEIDHEARFAARDLRLKRLEEQTKSLVNKVNKTTSKGVKIHYKLEELHNIYGSESSRAGTPSEDSEDKTNNDDDSRSE